MANKTITVLLKAITGAYRAEMTKAAASTSALQASAGRAGGATAALQKFLGPTGLAAAKVAVAFGAAGGMTAALVGSAKAAIQFESDFAGVRKTVDGSPDELEAIARGFRTMATEIPVSTTELTKVGEAAGQLGISKDHILEFSRVMVDLGNTTNLSADEAATQLARLANIMQTSPKDYDRMGASIVHLGNNFATTEAEISEMSLRIAGAGNIIGLTEADVFGFATALTSVGVKAEAGGSAISRVFLNIQGAVQDGGDQLDLFAEISGQTATGFAKQFESAPAEAIAGFIEGLADLHEQGLLTNETFKALGLSEIRVRDALLRTAGAGDELRKALEFANVGWEQNKALVEEAEKRYETTASKMEVAGNAVKELGITLGQSLLPALGSVASGVTDVIKNMVGLETEVHNAGDAINKGFGLTLKQLIPFMGQFAEGNRDAADAQGLMANGLLQTSKDLDVYMGRLRLAEAATANTMTGTRDLHNENQNLKTTYEQVTPSMKLMEEHSGHVARALRQTEINSEQAAIDLELYGITAEGTAEEVEELTEQQEALQDSISSMFSPLGAYNSALEKKTAKEEEAARATAESTKGQSDSWEDHMGIVKVTGKDLIKELDNQIAAYNDWEGNLTTIAERGRADVAAELAAMGPEGAALAEIFANMTEKEFKEATAKWYRLLEKSGDDNTRSVERGLARTATAADKGTQGVTDSVTSQLERGVGRAAVIIDKYAGSLKAGLNPVIAQVGGKKITLSPTAAAAYIRNKLAADGGVNERDRSSAHMVSGMSVMYGEPETGGEAFIPLSPAKRPRSRMIADETVKRLGGQVQWMATGGFMSTGDVPKVPEMPFPGGIAQAGRDAMGHTRQAVVAWLDKNLPSLLGSATLAGPAGGRYRKMWAIISKRFPDIRLHSGYRAGAITATGNPSYHGMGRAIDISPWMKAFDWIRANYGGSSRELIFSKAGGRQIHNGRPHFYGEPTRGDHWDHIHWAMKEGGILARRGYQIYLRRLLRRLNKGYKVFEDFSFPGMGKFANRYNDDLADRFYGGGGKFGTRKQIAAGLRKLLMADGGVLGGGLLDKTGPRMDADHDKVGVPVQSYDQGGFLPRGLSMAYNGTGAPEPVGGSSLAGATIIIEAGLGVPIRGEIKRVLRQGAREHAQAVRAGGG